jgi:hypothetical protein
MLMSCEQMKGNITLVGLFILVKYSSVGIATGYGLDDRGEGVRVPIGARISFPLLQVIKIGSGNHHFPM